MDFVRYTDWLFVLGCALLLSLALLRGYRAATHPLLWFLVGTSIFLHVGSIRDHLTGEQYIRHEEIGFRALEAVHLASLALGYKLTVRNVVPSVLPTASLVTGRFLLLLTLSFLLRLYFSNPFTAYDAGASNYTLFLGHLTVPAACLAIVYYEQRRRRLRGALRVWALLITAFVLVTWTFSASRTPVMYGLTCAFGYILWRNRGRTVTTRWVRRLLVVSLPLISAGLVALAGMVKGVAVVYRRGRDVATATERAIEHGQTLGFIDAYENGLFAYHMYPDIVDFRWASSYLALFLGPIPRSYWEGKPFGFSHHLTIEKLGYETREAGLSLATSLLGDMWACGGIVSVVAGSLAFGLWMGKMQNWRTRHINSVAHQVVFWLFLFLCMLSARGDIYIIFQRGGAYIILTWLLYHLCSSRSSSALHHTDTADTAAAQQAVARRASI